MTVFGKLYTIDYTYRFSSFYKALRRYLDRKLPNIALKIGYTKSTSDVASRGKLRI